MAERNWQAGGCDRRTTTGKLTVHSAGRASWKTAAAGRLLLEEAKGGRQVGLDIDLLMEG
jgi:hypothetical protein